MLKLLSQYGTIMLATIEAPTVPWLDSLQLAMGCSPATALDDCRTWDLNGRFQKYGVLFVGVVRKRALLLGACSGVLILETPKWLEGQTWVQGR